MKRKLQQYFCTVQQKLVLCDNEYACTQFHTGQKNIIFRPQKRCLTETLNSGPTYTQLHLALFFRSRSRKVCSLRQDFFFKQHKTSVLTILQRTAHIWYPRMCSSILICVVFVSVFLHMYMYMCTLMYTICCFLVLFAIVCLCSCINKTE